MAVHGCFWRPTSRAVEVGFSPCFTREELYSRNTWRVFSHRGKVVSKYVANEDRARCALQHVRGPKLGLITQAPGVLPDSNGSDQWTHGLDQWTPNCNNSHHSPGTVNDDGTLRTPGGKNRKEEERRWVSGPIAPAHHSPGTVRSPRLPRPRHCKKPRSSINNSSPPINQQL